jgi:HlyD family secretion protein
MQNTTRLFNPIRSATVAAMAVVLSATLTLVSCKSSGDGADASGAFESDETIISSGATGMLVSFSVEEGQTLKAGTTVGLVDTLQLFLRKQQLQAQIGATTAQTPDISVQIAALESQLSDAEANLTRAKNLLAAGAATKSQFDDAATRVDVLRKQIAAQRSNLSISTSTIGKTIVPIERQIAQIDDQLAKCRVVNPISGTVLATYAEPFEMVAFGKPLYKIANIDTLILRAYISNAMLSQTKLGQSVRVRIDSSSGGYRQYQGTVSWISDKAEFTPKTIQTKEERTELVYAIKVRVANDGFLKIGMYGEVFLH